MPPPPRRSDVRDTRGRPPKSQTSTPSSSSHSTPKSNKKLEKGHTFKVGDRILCLHVASKLYYDAKIVEELDVEGEMAFKVHYQGWNQRYDEFITLREVGDRFQAYTEQASFIAKEAQKDALRSTTKKRKSMKGDREKTSTPASLLKDLDANSSRSSTPLDLKRRNQRAGSQQSTELGTTSGKRASKRARDSAPQPEPKPCGTLDIFSQPPRNVVEVLVLDKRKVLDGMMAKVPDEFNVDKIVTQYVNKIDNEAREPHADMFIEYGQLSTLEHTTAEMQKQIAYFIRDLFNTILPSKLLYGPEKKEHERRMSKHNSDEPKRLRKTKDDKSDSKEPGEDSDHSPEPPRPSSTYGVVHLLRMLVRLPDLIPQTGVTSDSADLGLACAQDFVVFLSKNLEEFVNLDTDYVTVKA